MANRIQLRRGGAQEWQNSNPILAQGEFGVELDTGRIKIGDGVTSWNTLRYERPIESVSNTANTLVQRDTDGNFSAGTITATLIGNSATSSRLASSRQIQIAGDVEGSQIFDGSQNITITSTLDLLSSLPHHDNTAGSEGTYTKVVVDAKGRVKNASNPTTLAGYGLDTNIEGTGAQPYDLDLTAVAGLTTTGLVSRSASNTMVTRTITGTATRISINDGGGLTGNPTIDLITTAVTSGDYNTESLTSIAGTQTVNATKFTVDDYGRLTSATTVPIATAVEGTTALDYAAGTTYVRYDIIKNASKVYQAITGIAAGQGAPTHNDTSDAGGWRYLAAESTEQKGLASFAQEDFDVASGHVSIATAGVDNPQLQNSRVSFADGNAVEHFDLDQELTATTGYRGFNKLNYIKVNDTSGNLLVGLNNTGDSGAGELDVNVRQYWSDPDITLDGGVNQTLSKTGDGHLTFGLSQNSSSARNLSITSVNAGTGASGVVVTAEDTVTITASDAAGKVQVEDMYFQGDYIASSAATMILDPGDDRATSGKVQIMGDLQVDGTTTTVNSAVTTLDDPIITLGGDTAPSTDDNKDRGVEFRYYDSQARVGFFGYDDSAADLGGHTGAFSFLYDATNTSEVFSGTDAGIIAGNLKLTTNTNSTSNTTGDLVVAGGVGIGDDVNIGGLLDVDGTFRANSTSRFDDNIVFQGASKTLELKNGSGTTKTTLHTTTGNVDIGGILNQTGNIDAAANLNVAGLVHLESVDNPDILSGAPHAIQNSDYGALRVDGGAYFDKDVLFNGDLYLNGDFNQQEDATENYGLRNYLSVRYKLRAGSVGVYTPSYSNHNTSNLRVFGGAGVNTTLHVGATGSGQGLFVGKKNSGDTVKFSVDGPSGNVNTSGTLVVAGQTTINDSLIIDAANEEFAIQNGSGTDKFTVDTDNGNTVIQGSLGVEGVTAIDADFAVRNGSNTYKFKVLSASGDTEVKGTLTADGHTELNSTLNVDNNTTLGGTLEVTNNAEFNGTVDVDADFAVRSGTTDKATIASSSGNIATDGTLVVAGQTTINDSLIIDAANELFSVRNGSAVAKFEVDTDNGNTNIIGTVTIGDATQINDTLGVSNVVTFTRNTQQTLTGSYAADGAFQLTGGAGIGKNLAVGEGLRVYGGTELTGALDLNSSADISGALVTHDNVTITADNKEFAIQNGSGTDKLTVDTDNGNTDIRGTLDVGGDVTAESNLTITGNLVVNGTTTTVNSTVTTLDDPIITVGGDTAPASNDGKDRGVEFRYYDGSAKIGFFGYDRSSSQFAFLTSATNTSEVLAGTDGALRAGSLNLTAAGTALDVDNDANIDGALTVDGQIVSNKSSGAPFSIASTTKVNNLNVDLLDSMTTASANTPSTVVNRDSNGDFAAGTITAALTGNATTATTLATARDIEIAGVVTGTASFNGSADISITTSYADADITALAAMSGTGLVTRTAGNTYAQRSVTATASSGITITNADGVSGDITINVASTASNSANNLVLRDASGNFAAGTVTASLTGNVAGNVVGNVTGNVTGTCSDISNHDTDALTEGSTNLYFTNARADARADLKVAAATGANLNLASKSTSDLSEGTNQYYTEARVQAKLDNAYEQLRAMLNNLATATTLTLGLSGDPTPGAGVTAAVTNGGGGGFTAGTNVATSGGNGSSLTVNTTVVGGAITAAAVNAGGTNYNLSDTVTVTNPNAGKVLTFNLGSLVGGTGYTTGTALATTGGSGSASLTVDITASGGAITNITINDGGTGYVAAETITVVQAGGAGGTVAIATVATNATLQLTDVTTMEVGATLTGATSGTTGVITALGSNQITVDTVDGFFKKGEVVSANDVTTLTISSFS